MPIRVPRKPAMGNRRTTLSAPESDWPTPGVDAPWIDERKRDRAKRQWIRRARATYATAAQAGLLFREIAMVGAPVDILSGTGYACDELTQHLATIFHILGPFDSVEIGDIPEAALGAVDRETVSESVVELAVHLFGFNLALSAPVYRAVSAVSSDRAIADLAAALARSLDELIAFGKSALQWMIAHNSPRTRSHIDDRLPGLFSSYERLCGGSPRRLEDLAGGEMTLQTRSDNLGTLEPDELAVIFYDTLESAIFTVVSAVTEHPQQRWHRRLSASSSDSITTVGAVGLSGQ